MEDVKNSEIPGGKAFQTLVDRKVVPTLDVYAANLLRKNALTKPAFDEYAKPAAENLANSLAAEELELFADQRVIKAIRLVFAKQLRFMLSEDGSDQSEAAQVFETYFTAALVARCFNNSAPEKTQIIPGQIDKDTADKASCIIGNLGGDDQGEGSLVIA